MKSLLSKKKEFVYGSFGYSYHLIPQDRKTLSLTVHPDLSILLKCPLVADAERIESFLERKWFWLEKQLRFFGKYQRREYAKEHLTGEGFRYLGRQYKLVVKRASADSVSLLRGILLVQTTHAVSDGGYTKKLLSAWYREKTEQVLSQRFEEMQKRFSFKKIPELKFKSMKRRWGSFVHSGKIVLNPKLINMPKECIDYVIVHELCHLKYKNHDKRFFALLGEKYPHWEKVKEKLEIIGALDS